MRKTLSHNLLLGQREEQEVLEPLQHMQALRRLDVYGCGFRAGRLVAQLAALQVRGLEIVAT